MNRYRILHVTDIHRAPFDSAAPWVSDTLRQLAAERSFDVCVCSGDLADRGLFENDDVEDVKNHDPSGENGFDFLRHLLERASTEKGCPQLVIVPGNHDAQRPHDIEKAHDPFRTYIKHREKFPDAIAPALSDSDTHSIFRKGSLMVLPLSTCNLLYRFKDELLRDKSPLRVLIDEMKDQISALDGSTHADGERTESIRKTLSSLIGQVVSQAPVVNDTIGLKENHALHDELLDSPQWIRLAVSHHPLWPVPVVADFLEPFDVAPNGIYTVSLLQQLGFSTFLHGHTHYMGASLLRGLRSALDRELSELGEAVSIGGGHINLHRQLKDHHAGYGFQVIDISEHEDRAEVVVTNHVMHDGAKDKYDVCQLSINRVVPVEHKSVGRLRWVRFPASIQGRQFPALNDTLRSEWQGTEDKETNKWIQHLCADVVRQTGFQHLASKLDNLLKDSSKADQVLSSTMVASRQCIYGKSRGVESTYREHLRASYSSSEAMFFVDNAGNETWGHPNLIENTLEMFSHYFQRNRQQKAHEWVQGLEHDWVWKHPVEAFQKCLAKLFPRKKGQRLKQQQLKFGLCRLLVWKETDFQSPLALVLLTLHRNAGVPLLFVDQDEFRSKERFHRDHVDDLHLEWQHGAAEPSKCFIHESEDERNEIEDMAGPLLYCSKLLEYAKCPFALDSVKMHF